MNNNQVQDVLCNIDTAIVELKKMLETIQKLRCEIFNIFYTYFYMYFSSRNYFFFFFLVDLVEMELIIMKQYRAFIVKELEK